MDTCVREMTLGEEIISLTGKGVDIPTVERMSRKYIAITSEADTKKATEEYCHIDVNALFQTSVLPMDFKVGDQIVIPLGDLGIFTATAQKVTDGKVLFMFDDYITKRPMNKNGSNKGGYENLILKNGLRMIYSRCSLKTSDIIFLDYLFQHLAKSADGMMSGTESILKLIATSSSHL